MIYVGSTDGSIYCINTEGILVWSFLSGGEVGKLDYYG